MKIEEIIPLLEKEYGVRHWYPDKDPISVVVQTILSQNTSDVNSKRAFEMLLADFESWEAVVNANVNDIAQSIKSGGLATIKAKRIKMALKKIREAQGSLDLSFLGRLSLPEAKAYLQHLPGVGPKTASCVLLFSLGKPALPVDTHVFRVAKRLGLIDSRVFPAQAHDLLESQIPPHSIYQFHIHMIEHGRRVCHARRPRCHQCMLNRGCPAGKEEMKCHRQA
jgi:endonuclease-3